MACWSWKQSREQIGCVSLCAIVISISSHFMCVFSPSGCLLRWRRCSWTSFWKPCWVCRQRSEQCWAADSEPSPPRWPTPPPERRQPPCPFLWKPWQFKRQCYPVKYKINKSKHFWNLVNTFNFWNLEDIHNIFVYVPAFFFSSFYHSVFSSVERWTTCDYISSWLVVQHVVIFLLQFNQIKLFI